MIEHLAISYITDESGRPKAVQIGYEDWQRINRLLREVDSFESLKRDLTEAFDEVKELKKNKEARVSLTRFLVEQV
jgi:hypothetical protein